MVVWGGGLHRTMLWGNSTGSALRSHSLSAWRPYGMSGINSKFTNMQSKHTTLCYYLSGLYLRIFYDRYREVDFSKVILK